MNTMSLTTLDRGKTTVDAAAIEALSAQLRGTLLQQGDAAYDEARTIWNATVDRRPGLIVCCVGASDVIRAVNFARENRLLVSVRGGGHNIAGSAVCDGGLMIDLSPMKSVRVDPAARRAWVGPGATLADVDRETQAFGLAVPTGINSTTGISGLTLGGGFGWITRKFGLTIDNLVSADVVTADGKLLRASQTENPDLFWALRGGKAGLGIVTAVELRLVELETLYAGSLMFDTEHIEQALRAWIAWTADADPRITTSVAIARFPPFEQVPEPIRGRNLLSLRFAFPGPSDEGERLAQPLREAAPVYLDDLGEMVPTEMARISGDPTEPAPSWISARLLGELDDGFATALLAEVGPETTPPFVAVEVRHVGGATATDVEEGSAASGRGATFTIGMVGVDPSQFETGLPEAAAAIYERISDYLSDEGNPNFSAKPKTMADFESAFQPETRDRLRQVRSTYDPDGVFALWD